MADLSAERMMKELVGNDRTMPATAATNYLRGALVANVSGLADTDSSNMDNTTPVVGVVSKSVDNTSGANSAVNVAFKTGIFGFANDGGDAVDLGDVGNNVYVTDNQTVHATDGGSDAVAGICIHVDGSVVFVKVGN